MEQSSVPKISFEIRYTYILNFDSMIREVASPFIKFASAFSFTNPNSYADGIKLEFEEDLFSIEIRWDRIILLTQSNLDRLGDPNDSTNIMFELFEKITESLSFGTTINYLCQVVFVEINDKNFQENVIAFKDQYLNNNNAFENISDIRLTLEKSEEKDKKYRIDFGPFLPKDIERHGLIPFENIENNPFKELRSNFGIIKDVKLMEQLSKVDQSSLRNAIEEIKLKKDF